MTSILPFPGPRTIPIRYPSEAARAAAMAAASKTLRVIGDAGVWRIVQYPFDPGPEPRVWPIVFATETAAETFRHDILLSGVDDIDNDAITCPSEWLVHFYEFAALVLDLLEGRDGDSRALARTIAREALHHWTPPGPPDDRGEAG